MAAVCGKAVLALLADRVLRAPFRHHKPMRIHRSAVHLMMRAGLLFFILTGGQLPVPAAPAGAGTQSARELFRQHCAKCHGADGTGSSGRDRSSEIPDFTEAAWQKRRSDTQLRASILNGKGQEMPRWRGKLDEDQVRDLVAYIRTFASSTARPGSEKPKESTSPRDSEEEFRRLQKELEELKRQFRERSKGSADRVSPKPSESTPRSAPTKPAESSSHSVPAKPPAPAAGGAPAARELFRQHCVKCHGADGTGSPARDRQPEIPDFTDAAWQKRRSEARLLASILVGKGEEMPPWRGKISEDQARALVAHVRAFAPTAHQSGQEKPEDSTAAEPAEAKPPGGFFEKLIGWLGRFHPASIHFPIALLTAAAVAELLRLVTRQPAFDAVSRYCVWFGTLTAVVAGILGWFLGGLHLTDASWVLMAHRWLGTCTVGSAGLVLALGEVSCRSDRYRARTWFRVTLLGVAGLALATGFFGGAVVFGLDHYNWPR
jgi:mono/diheme cytochrome c family protein/uncharacterized membrane protein